LLEDNKSDFYTPEHERTAAWNEPILHIDWQLDGEPTISAKDPQRAKIFGMREIPVRVFAESSRKASCPNYFFSTSTR
jgi:hypothetical protein